MPSEPEKTRKSPQPKERLSLPPLSPAATEAVRLIAEQFNLPQKQILGDLMERLERHAVTPLLEKLLDVYQDGRLEKLRGKLDELARAKGGEVGGITGLGPTASTDVIGMTAGHVRREPIGVRHGAE